MATFQSFEEMDAWQKARSLTQEIYRCSGSGAFAKDYGLRDQIRRASVSALSNIAEGFERNGTGEFLQFLSVAKGSLGEVRAQLYVVRDQDYLGAETFARLLTLTGETARLVGGLMEYLRKTTVKGTKYRR